MKKIVECDGRGCNCGGNAVEKIEYNPIEQLDKIEKIRIKKRKVEKQMKKKGGLFGDVERRKYAR